MPTAKVFRSGNSQAIRLPKEFRFDVEELDIAREGEAIILRPHTPGRAPWSGLKAALDRGLSDDFMAEGREQPATDERPDLGALFE